jgi:hypothetical protein
LNPLIVSEFGTRLRVSHMGLEVGAERFGPFEGLRHRVAVLADGSQKPLCKIDSQPHPAT